ncbi:MAG: ribonuclease P protein component [Phormidesmis sp.]
MALPPQNRLRSNRDFGRVHRKGKRAATRHLAVRALKCKSPVSAGKKKLSGSTRQNKDQNKEDKSADGSPFALSSCKGKAPAEKLGPRFGVSISRKVSKRAVVRNRIKRQLKAIIRDRFMAIDPAWQIVIVVRPPAVECSFDDFLRELEYLLQKLAIVKR